jgi:hypothetical protein
MKIFLSKRIAFGLISIFLMLLTTPFVSPAKEYGVTNTNSSGPGSLSRAIGHLKQDGDENYGEDVKNDISRTRPFYTYGIYADKNLGINTLASNVSGTGIGLWYGKGYGLFAGDDIKIRTLAGNVLGTGATLGLFGGYASAYGLYAGKDIKIDTLSGTVGGTAGTVAIEVTLPGSPMPLPMAFMRATTLKSAPFRGPWGELPGPVESVFLPGSVLPLPMVFMPVTMSPSMSSQVM